MLKRELEKQMERTEFQDLEEDHRQRVAAAIMNKSGLLDNRSMFSHNSSKLIYLKLKDHFKARTTYRFG